MASEVHVMPKYRQYAVPNPSAFLVKRLESSFASSEEGFNVGVSFSSSDAACIILRVVMAAPEETTVQTHMRWRAFIKVAITDDSDT
jgi:hypothetical protein